MELNERFGHLSPALKQMKEFEKILIHFKLKRVGSQELRNFHGSLRLYTASHWKQKHPAWDSADIQMNSVVCPETGGNW